jgi:hypothetical protein
LNEAAVKHFLSHFDIISSFNDNFLNWISFLLWGVEVFYTKVASSLLGRFGFLLGSIMLN